MENDNKNNKKYTEETQEEILDALINKMEKSGATIGGLRRIIDAIEKRKEYLDEEKHEEDRKRDDDDNDKRIKIVRKTISPEVENGIVIAAYTDENGSLMDSVVYGKGEVSNILFMMTAATLNILNECDVSLENYIHMLQLFSEESKK